MDKPIDNLKIYLYFVKVRLLTIKEYRADFFLGLVSLLFMQIVNIVFLLLVFQTIPELYGWNLQEIMFIYGLSTLSMGIASTFFGNIGEIPGTYIVMGKLDRLLLRPIPALLHVVADDQYINNLGNVTLAVGILIYSSTQLHLAFTLISIIIFLALLVCSVIIYASIQLICVCTCFWFVDRWAGVLQLLMKIQDFSRYPLDIFNNSIRFFVTWIVPFAFTGFFPALIFLKKPEASLSYLTPLMAAVFLTIASFLWKYGLKRYESSGT